MGLRGSGGSRRVAGPPASISRDLLSARGPGLNGRGKYCGEGVTKGLNCYKWALCPHP